MDHDRFRKGVARVLSRRPLAADVLKDAGIGIDELERYAERRAGGRAGRRAIVGAETAALDAASPSTIPPSVVAEIESIIEEVGRPTLLVTNDDFELPADEELARRLKAARAVIRPRLASIGRVEVFDGATKWPTGTAWMISENIAITNRHVAETFAAIDEDGRPVLLKDLRGRSYRVAIDFREEYGSPEESEAVVESVIYLPRRSNDVADIALVRLADGQWLPPPIPLLDAPVETDRWIAVVGYPQPDDRIPPEAREIEERYFSNIYGVKRLSPGQIDAHTVPEAPDWLTAHDATTAGGHSGGAVIDLATGSAVGIHFKGVFKKANYAVHSKEIRRILSELHIPSVRFTPAPDASDDDRGGEEAAENLDLYEGYVSNFIAPEGDGRFDIPLPEVTSSAPGSVAELEAGGMELRYRNFSVKMNRERRLCYFSAVNIDGARTYSINGPRPGWRTDRRLDEALQIIGECYGPEPQGKFSRGHMTRREDPNWGDRREDALISNRHTFYVTNACPQIQPFNAGIWLSLEEYALENCDRDDMRIAVFTGPVFQDDDPEFFEVRIPVRFWKIIAFKHAETEELSATGYIMSQRDVLPTDEEFVYGQFRNSQVTIRQIEGLTGLSFHHLREHDPFDDGTEARAVRLLRIPSDIVFR